MANIRLQQIVERTLSIYHLPERKLHMAAIFKATAAAFDITFEQIKGTSRRPIYAHPRQVAMYIARRLLNSSFPVIATYLDKDHTTVLHAFKRTKVRIESDPELAAIVNDIELKLLSRYAPNNPRSPLSNLNQQAVEVESGPSSYFERIQVVDNSG